MWAKAPTLCYTISIMNLFSLQYFLFIFILLVLYYGLPKVLPSAKRFGWVILLAASLSFYAFSSGAALILMLVTAFSVWQGGRRLSACDAAWKARLKEGFPSRESKKTAKAASIRQKRRILITVLILNFGILAILKYAAPLLKAWGLSSLHLTLGSQSVSLWNGGLLLPLGISFYTFQAISYLIDQYNGKYPAQESFPRFLLYVSWFPQLLQGPIGRYDRLKASLFGENTSSDPNTPGTNSWDADRTKRALLLILFGLVKKYAVADMLSGSIASVLDRGNLSELPGSLVVYAILLYSAQQYGDFSGGIDIVTGVSALFGVELSPNFRQPYFATSLGDFWRRWHISLGAWMRDYLFYPFALLPFMQCFGKWCTKRFGALGKHLGRVLPAGIANLLVFAVVGIWHGPELHYLLWGLYNGLVIALSDLTEPLWKKVSKRIGWNTASTGFHAFRVLRTFLIVNIGWYFDRITDFTDCMEAFAVTLTRFQARSLWSGIQSQIIAGTGMFNIAGAYAVAAAGLLVIVIVSLLKERGIDVYERVQRISFLPRMLLIAFLMLLVTASFLFTQSAGGFLYANF